MKPFLNIHRLRENRYAYTIRSQGREASDHHESAFDSLETCLQDAGQSLGSWFPSVQMQYEGQTVGACTTELLRRNPKGLAERFIAAVTQRRR